MKYFYYKKKKLTKKTYKEKCKKTQLLLLFDKNRLFIFDISADY